MDPSLSSLLVVSETDIFINLYITNFIKKKLEIAGASMSQPTMQSCGGKWRSASFSFLCEVNVTHLLSGTKSCHITPQIIPSSYLMRVTYLEIHQEM